MTPAQLNVLLEQHARFTSDKPTQRGQGTDLLALAGKR